MTETPTADRSRKRVALVCTNFTMQSAFGLLILALNSARLGFETLIYFTFEGLNMIRPGKLEALRYYPTGADLATAEETTEELREVMERRDIPYPEDMLAMAHLRESGFWRARRRRTSSSWVRTTSSRASRSCWRRTS